MRKIILVISIILQGTLLHAQSDSSFRLISFIKGDILGFTVDNLDNIYILNSRNQVKKINANGDSVAVFNDVKRYGKATLLDVSNPLKLLLYYKDFATVVVLDRFLNVVNTIDLRKQNIFQAKAIGQSYDNKIWVYDEMENKLKKIDEDGTMLLETPDFRQLFGQAPVPQKIFDQDKLVYLYDSSQAVFVFDYYGTLKNKILIAGWNNLKVVGQYIYGTRQDSMYRYNTKNFRVEDWELPEQLRNCKAIHFSPTRIYALKQNSIEIYSLR